MIPLFIAHVQEMKVPKEVWFISPTFGKTILLLTFVAQGAILPY